MHKLPTHEITGTVKLILYSVMLIGGILTAVLAKDYPVIWGGIFIAGYGGVNLAGIRLFPSKRN